MAAPAASAATARVMVRMICFMGLVLGYANAVGIEGIRNAALLGDLGNAVEPHLLGALVGQQPAVRNLGPPLRHHDGLGVELRVDHGHLDLQDAAALGVLAVEAVAL